MDHWKRLLSFIMVFILAVSLTGPAYTRAESASSYGVSAELAGTLNAAAQNEEEAGDADEDADSDPEEQQEEEVTEAAEEEPPAETVPETEAPEENDSWSTAEETEFAPADEEGAGSETDPAEDSFDADEDESDTEWDESDGEDVQENTVELRTIKADLSRTVLYKKKKQTAVFAYADRFLWALYNREVPVKEKTGKKIPLSVKVSGLFPADAAAEAEIIEFADDPAGNTFREQTLFYISIVFYDGGGNVYIPEGTLDIELSGKTISRIVDDYIPVQVYSFKENEERAAQNNGQYAADAVVYRDDSADTDRLSYLYNTNDLVQFWENQNGLTATADNTIWFETEAEGTSLDLVVSAQLPSEEEEPTEEAAAEETAEEQAAAETETEPEMTEAGDAISAEEEPVTMEAGDAVSAEEEPVTMEAGDTVSAEEEMVTMEAGATGSSETETADGETADTADSETAAAETITEQPPEIAVKKNKKAYAVYPAEGSGNYRVTYRFFVWNKEVGYTEFAFKDSAGNTVYAQTVKDGSELIVPQPVSTDTRIFAGWYEGNPDGTGGYTLAEEPYDFDHITITEDGAVDLYAVYTEYAEVVFHDQYDSTSGVFPVAATRYGKLTGEEDPKTALVKIDDVKTVYAGSGEGRMAFYAWSYAKVTVPGAETDDQGNELDPIVPDENGCITVSEKTDLYPLYKPVHRLSFYTGPAGSGASYIPSAEWFEGDGPESLAVPQWDGYTFQGWYTGMMSSSGSDVTVDYGSQITGADGVLVSNADDGGVYISERKLMLRADTTLYAKWGNHSVPYRIIIWKQKTSGTGAEKLYDFAEGIEKTAAPGTVVSVDEEYTARTYEGFVYAGCSESTSVDENGGTVLHVYYDRDDTAYNPSASFHVLRFADSADDSTDYGSFQVPYERSLTAGNEGGTYVPADPVSSVTSASGKKVYSFSGWYADPACSTRVFFTRESYDAFTGSAQKVLYDVMPDNDLTIYAGWSADWYLVQIDPNYGTFNGTGGTWFWETWDGETVQEYTQVSRDYVESSSGTYYYVKHDRAYYGYTGNEWDHSETDRETKYTSDPGEATEDSTFEYAPGVYTYAGWYEVLADGTEVPYDFSRKVDHDTYLKLRWKKAGTYYLAYDAGDGRLDDGTKEAVLPEGYADNSDVVLSRSAKADSYTFIGWKVRGEDGGRIFLPGKSMTLHADDAVRSGGKDIIWLDAVYVRLETASVIYDANGGTIGSGDVDFGFSIDVSGQETEASGVVDNGTAAVSGLPNNSRFRLSSGTGFAKEGAVLAGWSDQQNYDPKDPDAKLLTPGSVCIVDSKEPKTLYAVWRTTVTYHLTEEEANWGGTWDAPEYSYNEETNTYTGTAYIRAAITEPAYIPEYTGSGRKIFRYWTTDPDPTPASAEYDFSQPVSGALDLYACWSEPNTLKVHAVDASAETLAETNDWAVNDITVDTEETELTAVSHVTAPAVYEFAFAAVSDSLEGISESNAVTTVKYDSIRKRVCVKYAGETSYTALADGKEVYFVYFNKKTLPIGYKSIDEDDQLSDVSAAGTAPTATDTALGTYNMAEKLASPLDWVEGSSFTCYAYGIGGSVLNSVEGLHMLTSASSAGEASPQLQVRNTWRGFEYSEDGLEWTNCGYDPELYVIYYTQKPTVVTFNEETVGDASLMEKPFAFEYVVAETKETSVQKQRLTDGEWVNDGDPLVTTETPVEIIRYSVQLKDNEADSVVLFYGRTETIDAGENDATRTVTAEVTAQKVTITQTPDAAFSTEIDGVLQNAEPYQFTYTADGSGGVRETVFTNTHKAFRVEVHVAMAEHDGMTGGIVRRDSLRSSAETAYSFDLALGESAVFTEKLPEDAIFTGDTDTYSFGTVLYGSGAENNGDAVTVAGMDIASISYERTDSNLCKLVLKDADGNTAGELDGNTLYYLYYPMPLIRYVKADAAGNLTDITGSLPDPQTGEIGAAEAVTYNHASLTLNGKTVKQREPFALVGNDFTISQSGKNFRMPPILDDGIYERYLKYTRLGAGNLDADTLDALDGISDQLVMKLRVRENALQYSFDGESWRNLPVEDTPCIYAVYTERGYDLQISKTVDMSASGENAIFADSSYTVTISSGSITADSYEAEGAENASVEAVPAEGTNPGTITFTVEDGTRIRLKGMPRGNYTITESENENYDLTAKTGSITGSQTTPAEVIDNQQVSLALNAETRVELINSPKQLCKINDNGTDHIFYTLRSAVEYVEDNITSRTAEIEMLADYLMPAADTVEIPAGYDITLTTAENGFTGAGTLAVITRTEELADAPMFTNSGALTFKNMILDGASVKASVPVISSTGDLTIGAGTVIRNAVNTGNGGAVNASGGDLTISSGTIRDCQAASGGAVYYTGSGSITVTGNAVLQDNKALTDNGGAIYAAAGTISLSGTSRISGNSAEKGNGGAVYAENAVVNINQNAALENNKAKNGGAVYVQTGTVSISETNGVAPPQIRNNQASVGDGGAIYTGSGSVSVTGGTITSNTAAAGNGGAVYTGSASVSISGNSVISENAAKNGGAVYSASGTVDVTAGTMEENNAAEGAGGAVYAGSGNVRIACGNLQRNTAGTNGGAVYAGSGNVTVTGGSITNNTAQNDGGAVCTVSGSITVSAPAGGTAPAIARNTATAGNGGAFCTGTGTVSITDAGVTDNRAGGSGGAVYADKGAVTLNNALLHQNTAGENGGALYARSGNVTVSGGSMNGNTANSDGGAVYVGSGTASLSDSSLANNSAESGRGGAVCMDSGNLTLNTVTATGNSAENGAAVFVNIGNATINNGSITGNTASAGGAVGVGSTEARLILNGNVRITGNTLDGAASNVYLDQDDDAVINIDTLGGSAAIGIHVPDAVVNTRSVPGARFAVYTSDTNANKITNDRFPALTVQSDTAAKKLYWSNAIKVEVRYLASYSGGFPPAVTGTSKYTNNSYYPEFHDDAISDLAAELNTKYSLGLTATAVYGGAFREGAAAFDDYVTTLTWNTAESKWQLTKRDGSVVDLEEKKIIIYYAEPAYISIENNTDMPLTISDMKVNNTSVINSATTAGYGMVFAKNGAIRDAMLPVSAADLQLAAGQSVNLLIPGGRNMNYTLDGSFDGTDSSVRVRRGAAGSLVEETASLTGGAFAQLTGRTLNASGTYKIIFGDDKYICKVVDADGEEHPYSKISDAITAIKNTTGANPPYTLKTAKTAVIEMLTDYLLPASDAVVIPQGYDITLTTAAKSGVTYAYTGEGDRAIISRDSENTNSMITSETGNVNSKFSLTNLIIDGKSVRGNSAGGAVRLSFFEVALDTVDFVNVYAQNGGALYIDDWNNSAQGKANSKLTAANCRFSNCNSTLASGNRIGGGAIHFFGNTLIMTDCVFENCNGGDQAGAVFHRVDSNVNSWTTISGCSFTNCSAKAAGGLELDSKTINVSDCTFEHCVATERNGGGFNVYALNSANPAANTNCSITLTKCTFNDCQAYKQNGGGFRSTAVNTTVNGCIFTNTSGAQGGGIALSNTNARKGEIYGCSFDRCTATNQGGGIYAAALELIIGDYTDAESGETAHTEVKNCTSSNDGGGVFQTRNANGSSLSITNAVITGNQTKNNSKNGGGVYTNARTVNVDGTKITDNTCTSQGGGIYAYSYDSLTITDSDISRNNASGNGGGVWFDIDSDTNRAKLVLTVKGSTIDGNTSNGNGGGIYSMAKTVTISASDTKTDEDGNKVRSSVSDNTAKTNGGGIFHKVNIAGSKLTVSDTDIDGNTANSTGTNTVQGGGGIFAGVRELEITNSSISGNTARSHGGGITFEIADDTTRDVMKLTAENCTLDGNTSGGNGGGIYTLAKTVVFRASEDGTAEVSNCTAALSGGGIYQNRNAAGSALTVANAVISGNTSNDTNTGAERGGGGVFANVQTVTVTGSEIRGNNAKGKGGGITAPVNGTAYSLIVDSSKIIDNTSGNQGGGIYTRSQLTLRNGTEITGNRLLTNTAADCAGVYLPNERTLFVGPSDANADTRDTIYVRENHTSAGVASNLRLWDGGTGANQQNNAASTHVYCHLDGEIHVVNANKVGTVFGDAQYANPDGFSDDSAVFKADASTLHGIIDRTDPAGKKIIWAGPPIAKITDGEGNLLYMKANGTAPAIFDRLGTGNDGNNNYSSYSTVAAFNMLCTESPALYTKDGELYTGSTYCIKMLDDYETGADMNVKEVPGRNVIFTTAGKDDKDGYPYVGPGTRATVTRTSQVAPGRSLMNVFGNLTLENIVIDGGSENGITPNGSSRCLYINQASYAYTVILGENCTLQNADTTANGGGVMVNAGNLVIRGGVIRNCKAANGGAVYENTGSVQIEAGNIYQCIATANGAGVYQNNGRFTMSGGTIRGGEAGGSGGGVYIANGKTFTMSGGSITGNNAAQTGGGIAIGGADTRLYFSGKVNIAGNTCDVSSAPGNACNVELNQNTKAVINTNNGGLFAGAYIGVYVSDANNAYTNHGTERKDFGTFVTGDNTTNFYSFVNDRNGLKGGIIENPDPNTIYWIQIFSLQVSKEVVDGASNRADPDEEFSFTVNIRGRATVSGQLHAYQIDSTTGDYGEMVFTSNNIDTATATFTLKAGKTITGVNLSEGLTYEVIENLTGEQAKKYAAMPAEVITSRIGENKGRTDIDPYTSSVTFTNIRPVCKITDHEGNLLYRKITAGGKDYHVPAVYTELTGEEGAFKALEGTFYHGEEITSVSYAVSNGVQIQMLIPSYSLTEAAVLPAAVKGAVTLTTASVSADKFPYQGTGTTATIRRDFAGGSMFTAAGDLTLEKIILDGVKGSYTTDADGGIVTVPDHGKLTIQTGAVLQNAKTEGRGGAVYAAAGGTVVMTGGTINRNESDGNGAGIFLTSGAVLELSGSPSFGGKGTDVGGNITALNGNFRDQTYIGKKNGGKTYEKPRQDIYIEETGTAPASIVLTGDLTAEAGSVWVFAEHLNHYAMMKPFARITADELNGAAYAAFRNAQPDDVTNCGGDSYLSGSTGEKPAYVYWSGGFDISFRKTDGFGNPMAGAVFTLYTDALCNTAYMQGGNPASAESADGTDQFKDKTGETLEKGQVLFESIPAGVYYMKEKAPEGYLNALTMTADGKPVPNVYIVLVGDGAMQDAGSGVLENITEEIMTARTGTGDDKKDSAIFLLDTKTGKALEVPDISSYGILNISKIRRKAILRKTSSTFVTLPGAVFDILRYDRSVLAKDQTAGTAGAFWIGELPFGTYYIHETGVPAGYDDSKKWFELTVDENGAKLSEDSPKAGID